MLILVDCNCNSTKLYCKRGYTIVFAVHSANIHDIIRIYVYTYVRIYTECKEVERCTHKYRLEKNTAFALSPCFKKKGNKEEGGW